MGNMKKKKERREHVSRWSIGTLDEFWYISGQQSGIYPPSFYAAHTEEEIQELHQQCMEQVRQMAQKYDLEIGEDGKLQNNNSDNNGI